MNVITHSGFSSGRNAHASAAPDPTSTTRTMTLACVAVAGPTWAARARTAMNANVAMTRRSGTASDYAAAASLGRTKTVTEIAVGLLAATVFLRPLPHEWESLGG